MFTFECQQCGKCCRATNKPNTRTFMILTDEDLSRIAAHLELEIEDLCSLAGIKDHVIETTHQDCPFVDDDGSCTIHSVKPHYCAQWPYIKLHNRLDKLEEACAECVGLKIKGR